MRTLPFKKIALAVFLSFIPMAFACGPCSQYDVSSYPYAPPGTYTIEHIGAPTAEETVVRAAIDIGSGATKLRIVEINVKEQKIIKVLEDEAFTVHYQEHLEKSPDNSFDESIMQLGIDSLKQSLEIAKQHHVSKVIAVATAAFRKASNADAFIERIERETGIKIHIIDQELEGKLAFEAALNQLDVEPTDLIVWDIGGGSFQLTMQDGEGNFQIYRGHMASVPFKNRIIKEIQLKDTHQVTSPNPMTLDEIHKATEHARIVAEKVDHLFRERIQHPNTRVVGVGSVFAYGIGSLMKGTIPFTADQLKTNVDALAGKTDADRGGGDFASVSVSNPILVLGFMQDLKIPQLNIIDVNNADGAFLYEPFWK